MALSTGIDIASPESFGLGGSGGAGGGALRNFLGALGSGGLGLGFSSSKTKGTSSSTGSGTSVSELTRFDPESKAQLDAILGLFAGKAQGPATALNRQSAIADASGLVSDIFRQFQEQALPKIYEAQAGTGGYNSSSAQFMANDAFAEATSRAAATVLDTIQKYTALDQQQQQLNLESLFKAFGLEAQALEKGKTSETYSSSTTSSSKTKGSSLNLGFGGK